MNLMGLDIGTTSVKAAIFNEEGQQIGYGFEECCINCTEPGMAQQDVHQLLSAVRRVMVRAVDSCEHAIAAIGLSVQGDAIIAADENYDPLCPAYLGMDYRCSKQADAFAREEGAYALFKKTGMRPHPINSLCKIRYITECMPEIAAKTKHFMTYEDFFLRKLGAEYNAIDFSMAGRTMGYQLQDRQWDKELLKAAGISVEQLSTPVPSATVVGRLAPLFCEELGLACAPLLVTGGHDQACAALGAGLVKPGLALDSHGTAEVVSTVLSSTRTDKTLFDAHFPCYPHVIPSMYFTFSLNHTGGLLLKWFVENFCAEEFRAAVDAQKDTYTYLLSQLQDCPSPVLVLPYLAGRGTPECNPAAKGLIAGLTLATTRYDIARAILESLCFDMQDNIEALRKIQISISSLRCVGGGARSPISLQLKADITGLPVHTLEIREAACFGAAILAGVAAGAFKSACDAAALIRIGATYLPNPTNVAAYRERYALYRELYPTNCSLLERI